MCIATEFLKGLSHEEAASCLRDDALFGNSVVEVVDGVKRRIPPNMTNGTLSVGHIKRGKEWIDSARKQD